MKRARVALLVVTGILLVGSCGSEEASDGGGSSRDPDAPVSSTPEPQPTGPVRQGAQKVVPTPGMDDVRASRFEKAKAIDENTVRVFFYQGVAPCSVLDRVDVEYGTQTVGITLQIGHAPSDEDTACIEIAVYNYVDVDLDESLDGRKVVDGGR